MCCSWKIINELNKVLCSTTRCCLHHPTHNVCTIFESFKTFITPYLGKDVLWWLPSMHLSHTWCNGISFKFMSLTISSHLVSSFENFATFAFSFQTLILRRYKYFSLCASTKIVSCALPYSHPYQTPLSSLLKWIC